MSAYRISDLPERMQNKVVPSESGCWVWVGARNKAGYGSTSAGKRNKSMLAHRRSYMELVGPIPEGLEIDHLCFNTSCINPEHLEPVTGAENLRRQHQRYAMPKVHYAPDPALVALLGEFTTRIRRNLEATVALSSEEFAEREERRRRLHEAAGTRFVPLERAS